MPYLNASSIRQAARAALRDKWGTAIMASLVYLFIVGLLESPVVIWGTASGEPEARSGLWSILVFIVQAPLLLGISLFFINLSQSRPAEAANLFARFDVTAKAVLVQVVMIIKIFLWSLLFVIPGIIAAYRYAMAPYILAENPTIPSTEVIPTSCRMMQGHKMELFMLQLSFIGWLLLSALTFGIAYIGVFPYMQTAMAEFYHRLSGDTSVVY